MLTALLLAGAAVAAPGQDTAPELAPLDHAALSKAIAELADSSPLVERSLVATSRGGRAVEVLTLRPADAEPDRPAILLVANLTGPEVFSSSVALQHAQALAAGYGTDEKATALLDACTVYVIPRADPDAAEARFETPREERQATGRGVDDDRDEQVGEDPPQDVDGDGLVTWMRWEDPEGTWIADPTDARALVEAKADEGQRGVWKYAREGRDQDGDERVSEDAPLDAVLNRNFAAGWDEHAPDAGLFPTDEPEARGLCDFVIAHPDIELVVTYDGLDDLVEKPKEVGDDAPPVKRIPPTGVLASDAKDLARFAKDYRDVTGNETKGRGSLDGSFQRWCYEHRGLLVLAARPWGLPEAEPEKEDAAKGGQEGEEMGAGEKGAEHGGGAMAEKAGKGAAPKPSKLAKELAWIDAHEGEGWRFVAWHAFDHPDLGKVEIGGLAPFAESEPPAAETGTIAAKHLAWFEGLARDLARVEVERFEQKALGDGVWRVELVLVNHARLPYASRAARRANTVRPARVTLVLPEAAKLVAGSPQHLVEDLAGVDGRFEADWLVLGPEDTQIGISVDTDRAGDVTRNAEVVQ